MTATIVTGASRGLGLGIARRLVASGRTVVLAARDAARLDAVGRQLGAVTVPTDVSDPAQVERLVAEVVERGGGIDAVVNNAAAEIVLDPLEDLTAERFRRAFEVDVLGTLLVSRAAAPHLGRGGRIVNVVSARGGAPASPAHLSVSPPQAALMSLTENLAVVLADRGIAVHALLPALSLEGDTGRRAVPALGVDPATVTLTADAVGDAVVGLLGEATASVWAFEPSDLSLVKRP